MDTKYYTMNKKIIYAENITLFIQIFSLVNKVTITVQIIWTATIIYIDNLHTIKIIRHIVVTANN